MIFSYCILRISRDHKPKLLFHRWPLLHLELHSHFEFLIYEARRKSSVPLQLNLNHQFAGFHESCDKVISNDFSLALAGASYSFVMDV